MKIVVNTFRDDILIKFTELGKNKNIDIIGVKNERDLLAEISQDNMISGFILNNCFDYTQKAIDFIRKKLPLIPIVVYTSTYNKIKNADILMSDGFRIINLDKKDDPIQYLFEITIQNINSFKNTFKRLQKITITLAKPIKFGNCVYDPTRRNLTHNNELIKKLTAKEGGIIELLSTNLGDIVKKDIILEKVWHKTDYYSSRSMDVYVTNLRKLLQKYKINLTIKNISGEGLILE